MSERCGAPWDADKRINAATMPETTPKSNTHVWFRLYRETLDDPKVQRLPAHLFKAWVNLLCLAASTGGTLPSIDDIAFRLRVSAQDARAHVDELVLAGLIDIGANGAMTPHNWSERQARSDVSRERTRRYRQRKASQSTAPGTPLAYEGATENACDGDVTSHVTGRDAKGDGLESESEKKRYINPLPPSPGSPPDLGFEDRIGVVSGRGSVPDISARAKLRACRDLGIADAEPIVAAFADWQRGKPPDKRARQADALFVASARKIFHGLTEAERARCGRATDDPAEIKPKPVTASPQLVKLLGASDANAHPRLLAKGGRHDR